MTVLRPMKEPEYEEWREKTIPAYAADKVASGQWSTDESVARSAQEHGELLPLGLATPDNHLFTIQDSRGKPVGMLWFAEKPQFDGRIAFVFNIEIDPEHQRRGHALRALMALEAEARRMNLTGIALHVFGHNQGARALYAKLGFEPLNISLFKPLGTTEA